MTTYSLFKTLHAPTGVDNSIYCNFLNDKEQNLITTSSNQLQIYKLNSELSDKKLKFECLYNFQLFGTISSIAKCRYGNMKKDAIIIAFIDAKVSIVEYNELTGELDTISIHFFEDEIEAEGINYNFNHPILRVDPNMRCAVMLIYGFKLAVIPFNDENNEIIMLNNNNNNNNNNNIHDDVSKVDDFDELKSTSNGMNGTSSLSSSSYVIDLRKLDNWLTMRIIDIEFLYGYYEPTLFILCESNRTWVGRYAVKKDTCNSISLSINLNQKTNPLIWPVDKLPSDCLKAIAVPQPISGVLIFTVNGLIYINQSVPSYGVSLNSITKTTTKFPFKNMEYVKITLDCSYGCFISSDQLIVSLKGGELYIITLITDTDSLRSVRGFHIEKGPGSVIASCLIRCFDNYLFIGSRLGNSVLVRYNAKANAFSDPKDDIYEDKQIQQSLDIKKQKQNDEFDELDHILDTDVNEQLNTNIISYQFEICDILLNIAPCGHTIIGESQYNYKDYLKQTYDQQDQQQQNELGDLMDDLQQQQQQQQQQKQKQSQSQHINYNLVDLVSTSGYSKNGSISILQRSLRPEMLVRPFMIENIIDMWSIFSCYDEHDQHSSTQQQLSTTYLFLTRLDSTMILKIADEITELDKNLFCTKQPTINVTNINSNLEILFSEQQQQQQQSFDDYKLNRFILQITPNDLFVYDSNEILFSYKFLNDFKMTIKSCSILDPFIVILTESSELFVYLLYENKKQFKIKLINRELYRQDLNRLQCFTIYKDEHGLFEALKPSNNDENNDLYDLEDKFRRNSLTNTLTNISASMTVDDEDELLYGTSANNDYYNDETTKSKQKDDLKQHTTNNKKNQEHKEPTYWLFTVSIDNNLNIYYIDLIYDEAKKHVLDFNLNIYFTISKFSMGPKLLINQLNSMTNNNNSLNNKNNFFNQNIQRASSLVIDPLAQPNVNEILMVSIGHDKSKPYLISYIDEEIIIYEAFYVNTQSDNETKLRFKRVTHDILIRDRRRRKQQIKNKLLTLSHQMSVNDQQIKDEEQIENHQQQLQQRTKTVPLLRQFNNIAGYNGVFICGLHSYFLFQCTRSGLTTHPLWFDGQINSFAPLKNSSITLSGFIYINKKNDVRICTLPIDDCNGKVQIYYDSQWVLRKIQLRQTTHYIIYHDESKTYACITSVSESTNQLMQLGAEENPNRQQQQQQQQQQHQQDPEIQNFNNSKKTYVRDDYFILPQREQFTLQLYTANTWEPLPLGKFSLSEWEHATTLKLISLPYEGHSSGFRSYIVVSTANCYNEDVNSRGRIIIFDIIEVEPEPGQPLTATKMKKIYDKEQKGPVTCIESVGGNLVGAVGQKIYLWEFKNGELIGRAFVDINFYVHKMVTLKNFILVADVHHSIALIRFQDEYKKLSFVAKDKRIMDTYACEYLVDNTNVSFLATDAEQNLSNFMYTNESHDNQGGQWLIRKGEFHVGSHINSMFRLKCNVNDPNLDKRSNLADKRQVTYFSTLDGAIGYVVPITEKTFRRLFMLQNALNAMIQHIAALNPKAFRVFKSRRKELSNPQKNILDGDLLFKFFDLSFTDRNDISKRIKSSTEQILDDLIDVFQYTEHF